MSYEKDAEEAGTTWRLYTSRRGSNPDPKFIAETERIRLDAIAQIWPLLNLFPLAMVEEMTGISHHSLENITRQVKATEVEMIRQGYTYGLDK